MIGKFRTAAGCAASPYPISMPNCNFTIKDSVHGTCKARACVQWDLPWSRLVKDLQNVQRPLVLPVDLI